MKKITKISLLSMLVSTTVFAQDPSVKDIKDMAEKPIEKKEGKTNGSWTKGGILTVNATQQSFVNWIPAGVDEKYNVTGAAYLNLFANKMFKKSSWENNLNIFLAYQTTKLQGGRKIDDRFDFTSRFNKPLRDPRLNFTTFYNLRTQLFNGYQYISPTEKKRTSGFFAPAIMTLAPGFGYKPNKDLSIFVSPCAGRATFVTNGPNEIAINLAQPTPYGVDPEKQIKWEFGYFASINYKKDLAKNVTYQGRLDVYGNYIGRYDPAVKKYVDRSPEKADIFWTNVISMKVNNWLNVTYSIDFIYDDDTKIRNNAPEAQIRSMLGVGFGYKF